MLSFALMLASFSLLAFLWDKMLQKGRTGKEGRVWVCKGKGAVTLLRQMGLGES